MVMLADTDAGSVITASQSGARWGFRLLALQVLLVPVLYLVMELTVRLGITTGKGYAALIRERFGPGWAYFCVAALLVSVVGALVTEFAGIAGAGELFGVPRMLTVPLAAGLLVLLVVSGGYRRVEIVGISLGLLELTFVGAALFAHPSVHELASGVAAGQPLRNGSYLGLVAANVGAVVMPWMLFYQQGAVVDKGLKERHLRIARIDIAVGAVLTQVVMGAVLVATAASFAGKTGVHSLSSVGQISAALTPLLGGMAAKLTLALGMLGAAFVAGIVVSLAAAWAVSEATGRPGSLNTRVRRAPLFYAIYAGAVVRGRSRRARQPVPRPPRGRRRDRERAPAAAHARDARRARAQRPPEGASAQPAAGGDRRLRHERRRAPRHPLARVRVRALEDRPLRTPGSRVARRCRRRCA